MPSAMGSGPKEKVCLALRDLAGRKKASDASVKDSTWVTLGNFLGRD